MKVAIIGAGYAGMAAAYDLVRAGHKATIFEGSDNVGGLAGGFKEPHWAWSVEDFYHHWFQSDQHMLGLINELGLSEKVRFQRPYTVVLHKGKWYPFDSIPAALMYPGLGWGVNKIRFGFVGLYLKLSNNWRGLEKTTVDKWMRTWAGNQVYESMWKPLMDGKFGPYAEDVNMAWMWARIHARTTQLGTYVGGFQAFANDFATVLKQLGVTIRKKTSVSSIERNGKGLLVHTAESGEPEEHSFERVLSTTSPGLMAKLAPGLPEDYLKGLLALKSMGAVVMTLSLDRQVSAEGYYWYNIPKEAGFPFLAMVEHTNFVEPENFGGDHILYCGDYLTTDHEYFEMSEEELLERFIPGIQRINPAFERSWIKKTWLRRTKYAQPVPLVNHSQNIPTIQTPLAGLYFASMSQVYPWDRGTNFAVEIGRKAAKMMME
jgi:protoporphyrinogen oxidase